MFAFRPWVRKAGLSILGLAAGLSGFILSLLFFSVDARFGWAGEPFVVLYLGLLWVGGVKVYFGSWKPVVELHQYAMVLRPLHLFGKRVIRWEALQATEQMIRGDRLMIYYRTPRGARFVALNLNLVKGRRDLARALEERLQALGFVEKLAGESRQMSRG